MDKINSEIEDMYSELMKDDDIKIKSTSLPTTLDLTTIRDSFRQHVNNRRNAVTSDIVLLDTELVENLITLKEKSFELLLNFKNAIDTNKPSESRMKTFTSFDEFVNFVINQQEILNSEQWKIEAINDYLNQLDLESCHNVSGF